MFHVAVPVSHGRNVVREQFHWTFSGGRSDDVSEYDAGVINEAGADVEPNTFGTLRLTSTFADGSQRSSTISFEVGNAPSDPPPPLPETNEPSTLGQPVITWQPPPEE